MALPRPNMKDSDVLLGTLSRLSHPLPFMNNIYPIIYLSSRYIVLETFRSCCIHHCINMHQRSASAHLLFIIPLEFTRRRWGGEAWIALHRHPSILLSTTCITKERRRNIHTYAVQQVKMTSKFVVFFLLLQSATTLLAYIYSRPFKTYYQSQRLLKYASYSDWPGARTSHRRPFLSLQDVQVTMSNTTSDDVSWMSR